MEVEARAVGLRWMRERCGLTQGQLAERLGIRLQDLQSLETGEGRPSRGLRSLLMTYFDCNFEDLFEVVMVHADAAEDSSGGGGREAFPEEVP